MEIRSNNKAKHRSQRLAFGIFRLLSLCIVLILFAILGFIIYKGAGAISWEFITSAPTDGMTGGGIWPAIVGTFYLMVGSALFAFPVGVMSGIYMNEYAPKGKLVRFIRVMTNNLSGIPSIIFGLFGMVFFGTTLGLGYSILTGALTLTLMVLPLITRNTQEALKTVPATYRSGALGIGATKWYMIRTILLPSAMPGIITGIILAIGRIVGESAALLFTAGSGYLLPKTFAGFFKKIFESGGTLTIQLYLSMSKAQYDAAFGIAAVLLIIVLFINLLTKILAKKFDVSKLD